MKFLIRFCGKKIILVLFSILMVTSLLDLLSIALIFPFLKLFTAPAIIQSNPKLQLIYKYFSFTSEINFIGAVGCLLILLYFIKTILKIIVGKIQFFTSNDVTFRLATHLFKELLNADYSMFTKGSASEMVGIVNAHTVHSVICLESWITILSEGVLLFLLLLTLIFINPVVTLILAAVFILIGLLLHYGLAHKIVAYGKIHSALNILVYKFAFLVSNSIKDIKIMGLEDKYSHKYSQIWEEYSRNDSKNKTMKNIPSNISELFVFAGIIIACLYIIVTRQNIMNLVPVFGVMALSAMRVLPSFNRISASYNQYKFFRNSLQVVENLYVKLKQNKQEIRHVDIPFKNKLEVRDLSFSFENKKVLDSISFDIVKGTSVAFVGPSGAGKSTLLDILSGLRKSDLGEFYLDACQFDPFRTDAMCIRIGYVPQNVNLIDESIAFNVSFEQDYDHKKMEKVIKIVRLSQFVNEMKDGLDTTIGESGVRISGGQKQRIGIARALYRDPEILIFDEATSALDSITEKELIDEINFLAGSKTLIMVAHRLTTVEKCDCIYLLSKGKIVDYGSHEKLLSKSSIYKGMYYKNQ